MRRAVVGLFALAVLSIALGAWTRTRTVVCIGDSNTAKVPSWCDMLPALLPGSGWRVVNRAQSFAIVRYPGAFPPNGDHQLRAALARDSPDVVIMAFGTNDLLLALIVSTSIERPLGADAADAVIDGYAGLRDLVRGAGAQSFIALTPPVLATRSPDNAVVNDLVTVLNERLRSRFPAAELIDFHSPMDIATDYRDDVHLNRRGQVKRALAACRALTAAFDAGRVGHCESAAAALGERVERGDVPSLPRPSRTQRPSKFPARRGWRMAHPPKAPR